MYNSINQKKDILKVLGMAFTFPILFSSCITKRNQTVEKLRICPEEWYINKMPMNTQDNRADEYFIIEGERRELSEFDLDWVKKNCSIKKPTEVF